MIDERLDAAEAGGGAIFDGFPRTVVQAQALDALLKGRGKGVNVVIRLKVDENALVNRITKRFEEQGRRDDNPEVFRTRLDAYTNQTKPLLGYYEAQGLLVEVDGMAPMDAVSAEIATLLDRLPAGAHATA